MWWVNLLYLLLGALIGVVAGFFIAKKLFSDQLKKNPPINEKMIRAMFLQMGRKPSETQIRQVMNSMNKYR
jgi:uncharacterized protein YneF (UPF0154 family)